MSLYNTAVVFAPSGRLVARYRKVFTWRPFEPYAVGTEAPPVFSIPNVGKVGVMICYDGWFPEMARSLALAGRRGHRASDAHHRPPTAKRSWCSLVRTRSRTSAT